MATITGTSNNDTLIGTPDDDTISGLDGQDQIAYPVQSRVCSEAFGDGCEIQVVSSWGDSGLFVAIKERVEIAGGFFCFEEGQKM